MQDYGGGPINSLTRIFNTITDKNFMTISPDYLWETTISQIEKLSLMEDWIKTEFPEQAKEILNEWFKVIQTRKSRELIENTLITSFIDKRDLAKQFLKLQPIYFDNSKTWWVWLNNLTKWKRVDEVDILNLVDLNSERVNTINSKEKGEIIESLKQEGRKLKPQESKKTWVQFRDNIIDVATDETHKATPRYFITNPIPYKLGETEDTPIIDQLFKEWVGEDYVKTLYQILAYCCLPDYPIHTIFCFIGAGCNGKSQFLKLLRTFIGEDNCCSTELDTLLNSRFEKTRLYKKLVCQMGETNFNEMSQTSLLKKLSGGDLIGYEFKNKDPFDAENYAKILIATNTLPSTTDKTIGFYRRWRIIDFPNRFKENNGDIIDKIPPQEYENLARKSLRLLKELLKNYSFHNEGTIEERAENYEEKSNPFEKFWKQKVKENFEGCLFKFELKQELDIWCRANGFRKLSEREIKHKMDEKNIETGKRDYFNNSEGQTKRYMAWLAVSWKTTRERLEQQEPTTSIIDLFPNDGKAIKISYLFEQRNLDPFKVDKDIEQLKKEGIIAEIRPGEFARL